MGFLDGPTTDPIVTRTYKDEKSYLKDAEEMQRRGYVARDTDHQAEKRTSGGQ